MKELDGSSPQMTGLDEVLNTEDLTRRPQRPADHAAEAGAMASLAETLANDPQSLPQTLVELALTLCRADSVGVSILELGADGEKLRWLALSGNWAKYIGETLPRSASPAGVVFDRGAPTLFDRPGRHFTALS